MQLGAYCWSSVIDLGMLIMPLPFVCGPFESIEILADARRYGACTFRPASESFWCLSFFLVACKQRFSVRRVLQLILAARLLQV